MGDPVKYICDYVQHKDRVAFRAFVCGFFYGVAKENGTEEIHVRAKDIVMLAMMLQDWYDAMKKDGQI